VVSRSEEIAIEVEREGDRFEQPLADYEASALKRFELIYTLLKERRERV
jgi:hypothetical protein